MIRRIPLSHDRIGSFRSMCPAFVAGTGAVLALFLASCATEAQEVRPTPSNPDLILESASVEHDAESGVLLFRQVVRGRAGGTTPGAAGSMDGAPVLAYVFPMTLSPEAVGFRGVEGVLALVATSHPDFDDTPLWDENGDSVYDNDGETFHTHWVVLVQDSRVPGGYAVAAYRQADAVAALPPTNPGMPLYLDSPGFPVRLRERTVSIPIPVERVAGRTDFRYDALTAYLQVNMSDENRPTLGVYEVYSLLSGDLSLPYTVTAR